VGAQNLIIHQRLGEPKGFQGRQRRPIMFENFYCGKRFLVTGVSGVKGTWLSLALLKAGAEVIGVDNRQPDAESNFIASGLRERITYVPGDVADLELMSELVSKVDGVFHLAAVVLVGEALRMPLETYRSNALGVVTVLEALRLASTPKRAVLVTTDKVYRPKSGQPWVETDPLGATGAYAVSKACAEFIIEDYYRSYLKRAGTHIGIARAGNVLIGGDLHSSARTGGTGRIFVDCFEALMQRQQPEIFSPTYTRPYTYGLDILSGYMTLMAQLGCPGVAGEAFNFGPHEQQGVSNALLATKICELWGGEIMWRRGNPREEPFEYQALSCEKSRERLRWLPALTLYESLDATTRWYKEWAKRDLRNEGSMYEFNHALLEEHRVAAEHLGIAWAFNAQPQSRNAPANARTAAAKPNGRLAAVHSKAASRLSNSVAQSRSVCGS